MKADMKEPTGWLGISFDSMTKEEFKTAILYLQKENDKLRTDSALLRAESISPPTHNYSQSISACPCSICQESNRYRWKTIDNCKCMCHHSKQPSGHDSLCCEYPNGYMMDNPFIKD